MRVMLIDDDADDCFMFGEWASGVDPAIECTIHMDPEKGLAALASMDPLPDYIFLDINMPKLNGFECLKIIRRNGAWRKIPVVIHSTSRNEEDIGLARELGASFYLVKSDSGKEVRSGLRYIFGMESPAGQTDMKYLRIFGPGR